MTHRILLKTTIPTRADDWSIARFSLLRDHLAGLTGPDGARLYEVVARDRIADARGDDPDLLALPGSDTAELWLFAVDVGDGLSEADCAAIRAFRARGGGCLVTRDHDDMGSSVLGLGDVGAAHHFHSRNPESDPDRQRPDDTGTPHISWPNYHSGLNGEAQEIHVVEPAHPLLRRPDGGSIRWLPAHPHEGAVGVPPDAPHARVVVTGISTTTGRPFNIAVAFARHHDAEGRLLGRAVAESTFHHFADYNWDPALGCPSFVSEPCGAGLWRDPDVRRDVETWVANLASWLEPAARAG